MNSVIYFHSCSFIFFTISSSMNYKEWLNKTKFRVISGIKGSFFSSRKNKFSIFVVIYNQFALVKFDLFFNQNKFNNTPKNTKVETTETIDPKDAMNFIRYKRL